MADLVLFPRVGLSSRAVFLPPCLPTKTSTPPRGLLWLHEIKHDGFRVVARKDGVKVRLYSRLGNDLTWRFPQIAEAVARLRSRSCIMTWLRRVVSWLACLRLSWPKASSALRSYSSAE